jgi:hypothetical protein
MQATIDRFEGDTAICETAEREKLEIKKAKLPAGAREGDVLSIEGKDISIDAEATKVRKDKMSSFFHELLK